jgi:predicted peroxiredoxin
MRGNAEQIKLGTFPSLKQVMDQAAKEGVRMLVCGQSCQMLGLKGSPEEFEDPAKVVGAATLNDLVLEADGVLSF